MAELTFEKAMTKLEEIVDALETGKMDLEQSLNMFKEGCGYIELCDKKLKFAALTVEELKTTLSGDESGASDE